MLCIYHDEDLDGICSAAIIKQIYKDIVLCPMSYNKPFPEELITDHGYNGLIIVDFTFDDPKDLQRAINICGKDNVTWIDHHQKTIDHEKSLNLYDIGGIRKIGQAACELTWSLFHGPIHPKAVTYIGRFDVWDHSSIATIHFNYGMGRYPLNPEDPVWSLLLSRDINATTITNMFVTSTIEQGRYIYEWNQQQNKEIVKELAYPAYWENHVVLVIFRSHINSLDLRCVFDPNKHDFAAIITVNGDGIKVGLRADSSDKIDLSEIAKKHGGGGHKGSASFYISSFDEITELLPNNKIEI